MTAAWRRQIAPGWAICCLAVGLAAGCGSGSQVVVRPPSSPMSTTPEPSATATTPVTVNPKIIVSPSRGLHDGQIVLVRVTGFGPEQSLVTIECVDRGDKTGQGDCNVAGLAAISVGASGSGSANFTVHDGPFGSSHVSCTNPHPCIVSVSQATASPTQTASARISFG